MNVVIADRQFVVIECYKCGVEFAMPKALDETAHKIKQVFFCPNGHDQAYTTSLRDTLAKVRIDLGEALTARDKAEAEVTRLRERAKAGVCAFCKRSFENLKRHMDAKHKKAH